VVIVMPLHTLNRRLAGSHSQSRFGTFPAPAGNRSRSSKITAAFIIHKFGLGGGVFRADVTKQKQVETGEGGGPAGKA